MYDSIHKQIDDLVVEYEAIRRSYRGNSEDIPEDVAASFVISGIAAIQRATGDNSVYSKQINLEVTNIRGNILAQVAMQLCVPAVGGTLKAVQAAVKTGYLDSFEQLVHASMFADFLEMADYLLNEGYKDPAAVIGGGVLEEHLRKLCVKHSIAIETTDLSGKTKSKKAELLNEELSKADAYKKLDQKGVTFWLDLRNKAAHAKFTEYDHSQVAGMLQGITGFILRVPA
jgi:hypothetical protein